MSDMYFVRGRWRAKEQAVMDLWEAGKRVAEIATIMEMPIGSVEKILRYMRETSADRSQSRRATALSSAALLAAIRRHHPERVAQ